MVFRQFFIYFSIFSTITHFSMYSSRQIGATEARKAIGRASAFLAPEIVKPVKDQGFVTGNTGAAGVGAVNEFNQPKTIWYQGKPFKGGLFKATQPLYMTSQEARKILGVSEGATLSDIDKAFKQQALQKHPDQGGSNQEMQKVLQARNTLRIVDSVPKNYDNDYDNYSNRSYEAWKSKPDYSGSDQDLYSLFFEAIENRSLDQVEDVLRKGFSVNQPFRYTTSGKMQKMEVITTPLVYAVKKMGDARSQEGTKNIIKALLKAGADVNIDSVGNKQIISPLSWAITLHDSELVKLLLDYGARPSELDLDKDPLSEWGRQTVNRKEDQEIFHMLIEKGAKPRANFLKSVTPFKIPFLVSYGIQDVPSKNGKTMLDSYYYIYPELDPDYEKRNYSKQEIEEWQRIRYLRRNDRLYIEAVKKAINALKAQHDEQQGKNSSFFAKVRRAAQSWFNEKMTEVNIE